MMCLSYQFFWFEDVRVINFWPAVWVTNICPSYVLLILGVLPYNCFHYYLYILNYAHLFKNWNIVDVQYYVSSRYVTQWFDIYIHYEMIAMMSGNHLSPHKIITMLLTIFLMLSITSPCLIWLITGSLNLFKKYFSVWDHFFLLSFSIC